MFSNLFGGAPAARPGEASSLLGEWKTYQTDVEQGGGGGVGGGSSKPATAASSSGSFASAQQSAGSWATALQGQASTAWARGLSLPVEYSIPTTEQLTYFVCFLTAGGVLLLLAFMLFLPVIILAPAKFALSFTAGCLLVMAGFAQLRGWRQQLQHMFSRERLVFTSAYLGSILTTLYAALFMHSYVLSLVCSGLQVVALLYYLLSYFPGGTQGVRFMLSMLNSAVWSCLSSVQAMVLR